MRGFVNILLIIILVVITPVFLLVTSLKTNVLHTTFLKNELERHDVYTVAFTVIDEQISGIQLEPEFPITHEEISTLVNKVLTPEWLQENVETVLDDFDTWLNAPKGTELSIVVSLAEPKANLQTEFDLLLEDKLADLEPCAPDAPGDAFMLCVFAGKSSDELKDELAKNELSLDGIVNQVPDNFDLASPDLFETFGGSDGDRQGGQGENLEFSNEGTPGQPPEQNTNQFFEGNFGEGTQPPPEEGNQIFEPDFTGDNAPRPEEGQQDFAARSVDIQEQLESVKEFYQLGQRAFWYAWIIYGVLILQFILLNATGGWKRVVRWTGILLLSIGILPLVTSLGSSFGQGIVLEQIQVSPEFPAEVTNLIENLFSDVRQAVFTLPLVVSTVLVVLGLGGVIGSRWIPKPKGKEKSKDSHGRSQRRPPSE